MVRVLHIVTYMGRGGLETMLMNYYRQMDKDQVQFDFLVHRQEEADYDQEILESGGKIYRISRLIPWSLSYKKNLISFFKEYPEYRIIHVHQDCLSSVALSCAKEAGVPVRIAHCHSASQDKNWKYPIKIFYKRKIAEYATNLMACSPEAGQWMFGKDVDVQILPNAINLRQFDYSEPFRNELRRELNLDDQLVIGHVGRFNTVKNHRFLLELFAEFQKQNPDSILLLVGDGPEKQQMKELSENLQIDHKVRFLGLRSDVNRLLMAMDVFCFPSLYEGLPVSLIEAQSTGLLCLVSNMVSQNCSVCPDLVTFLPIDQGVRPWIHALIKMNEATKNRETRIGDVRRAGYDIAIEAQKLQSEYLKLAREIQ